MKKSAKNIPTGNQMTLFSPVVSLVSPIHRQGSDSEKRTSAIYGPKCLESYERSGRATSWGKMLAGLLIGRTDWYSRRCRLIWRMKGTKYRRLYFQLVPLTRRTVEIESLLLHGLIPTVCARDYKGGRNKENLERSGRSMTNSLPEYFAQPGKTSQLNPRFALEMMGFPPDWTELPFQNGETKASRQPEMP